MANKNNVISAGSCNIIHGNSENCTIIQGSSNQILNKSNVHIIGDNVEAEVSDAFYVGCTNGLNCNGDIVAFFSSDERLKDNIKPIGNCLEKILSLDAIEFDWNDKQETYRGHDIGVIAQQVQKIAPEIVKRRKDGYLAIKYEKLIALLVGAVKEQDEEINKLIKEVG